MRVTSYRVTLFSIYDEMTYNVVVFVFNIVPQIEIVQSKNLVYTRERVIFHCISPNPTRSACAMRYILYLKEIYIL